MDAVGLILLAQFVLPVLAFVSCHREPPERERLMWSIMSDSQRGTFVQEWELRSDAQIPTDRESKNPLDH